MKTIELTVAQLSEIYAEKTAAQISRDLGISRVYFYQLLKKAGIKTKRSKLSKIVLVK